ncbi:MAG: MBL fold metallo-hydrolase [Desulfobacterales bacterium]|nr:MBL fold metallo-hydrolase [Desulfobacterales bacterium]
MKIHQSLENLYLVDLDQPLEGFRNFISSWIFTQNDLTILVDPGPRSTIPVLINAIQKAGVKKIDYILLTHIHIDHAGGAGLLLQYYPEAQVICHPQGICHMIDPEKLWSGSKKVLGHVAEVYGEIAPIPKDHISYQDRVEAGGISIQAFQTPGHAVHHLCYQIGNILFAGEVAGVSYPLEKGLYLRPATPPVFIYEQFRNSLEKIAALSVSHLCFGHYGYRRDPKNVFSTALKQLDIWLNTIEKHYRRGSEPFEEIVFNDLLRNDPSLTYFHDLPKDIQVRGKYFFCNSLNGIRTYLETKGSRSSQY